MTHGVDVFENWFARVWNRHDAEEAEKAIREMFPGGIAEGLGEERKESPEDFLDFRNKLSEQIKDINISILRSVDDGEWTALYCRLTGNCRKSGAPVDISGTVFGQVEHGKILHAENHWDFMTMWGQMGLLPEQCFSLCLSGTRVGS